jgi:dGTPase
LIDLLVSGLIQGTVAAAGTSGASSFEDVRTHPSRLAQFTPEVAETSRELKRFLYTRVTLRTPWATTGNVSWHASPNCFASFLERPERLPSRMPDRHAMNRPPRGVRLYRGHD